MLVLVVLLALVGILAAIGQLAGDDDPAEREAAAPTPTPQPGGGGRTGTAKAAAKQEEKQRKPTRVRLQIVPTGPVSVCLENAAGEPLIGNLTLDVGQDSQVFRGKSFTASFGTPAATMKVDGKEYPVSAEAPIGYELRPGKRPRALPESERPTCYGMSVRAGIVVTGTEVLSGIVADRNGPWLSERLRERGVEVAHIVVVGDRPADVRAALDFLAACDLIVTSGGLGPTADDLTADGGRRLRRAGRWCSTRRSRSGSWTILRRNRARWRSYSEEAMRAGQPQAGDRARRRDDPRARRDRAGTGGAAGGGEGATVLVLPGPPRELQPMWEAALETAALRAVLDRAGTLEQRMLRLYGVPEAEIARSLLAIEADGVALDRLEITTCLRRGEIEIATVFEPEAEAAYDAFAAGIRARHARHALLRGRRDDRRAGRAAARRADDRRRRVLHGRADGRAADGAGRARARTCSAALSCTPTRPRWRSPTSRRR